MLETISTVRWSVTNDDRFAELLESKPFEHANAKLDALRKSADQIKGASLPVFLSHPANAKRLTQTFIRGNWLERGDEVSPGIPDVFAAGKESPPIENRLQFARWLVSDANPLAARVWANRVWTQLFGRGLCETLEDFGSSGLQPTHPELIDYLASRLRDEYRWHLKPFLKEIVLSATVRNGIAEDSTPIGDGQVPTRVSCCSTLRRETCVRHVELRPTRRCKRWSHSTIRSTSKPDKRSPNVR